MARVITCGFETGDISELIAAQGITTRAAGTTNGAAVTTTKAKNGNYSLACLSTQIVDVNVKTYTKPATLYNKFDFLYVPVSGHTRRRLWWDAAATESAHASIFMNASGQLVYTGDADNVSEDAAILGTGIHTLDPNQWYEINITYVAGSVANGQLIVEIDGVTDISLINIDTNASAAPIARWRFGDTNTGNDFYFDNIMVNDSSTEQDASNYNTDRLNSKAIPHGNTLQFLLPNAEGSSLQWVPAPVSSGTTHYVNLNQIPMLIGSIQVTTTRINTSGAVGLTDLVNVETLPSTSGIRQIHVFNTNAHQSTARHRRTIRTDGANYTSQFDSNSVANSLNIRSDIWYVNPSDNKIWEKSDIDSLQIGASVSVQVGTSLNIIGDMNLYVEHYIRPFDDVDLFVEGFMPTSGQIFISNVDSILSADLDGSNPSIIIQNGDSGLEINGTAFIDIDTRNEKLLFMLLGFPSECRMANLDGTMLQNVPIVSLSNNANLVPGIAIDNASPITTVNSRLIIGPRVYLTDYSNNRILTGNIRQNLDLTTGDFIPSIRLDDEIPTNSNPVNVKYDDQNRILFWTEEDQTIHKMVDGGNDETIITSANPLSLAINPITRKIYFAGRGNPSGIIVDSLLEANYYGSGSRFIFHVDQNNEFLGFGLDLLDENVYFLIYGNNKVYRQDVDTFNQPASILQESDGVDDPRDAKVYLFEQEEIVSISRQKAFFIAGASGLIHSIDTPPPQPGTPDGPPLPSGTPPPDDEDVPAPTSLSLFLAVPEMTEGSIDFFVGSIVIEDYLSLFLQGPEGTTSYRNLSVHGHDLINDSFNAFTEGQITVTDDIDIFVSGIGVNSDDIDLSIHGHEQITDSIDLFVDGKALITDSVNLFVEGYDINSDDIDLSINGHINVTDSINQFIHGIDDETDSINLFVRAATLVSMTTSIDTLTIFVRTSDYDPQVIGRFTTDVSFVMIEIWTTDNDSGVLSSDVCYQIGNTRTWAWSTANLPLPAFFNTHYVFKMTADNGEAIVGEFILKTSNLKTIDHDGWNNRNRFLT